MTTRFWVWENSSFIRLALKEGESLSHHTGGPTEEGYSYSGTTWTHEGGAICLEYDTNASDCDGRLDTHGELTCPIDQLAARDAGFPDDAGFLPMLPEWEHVESGQRDYNAEAAGY